MKRTTKQTKQAHVVDDDDARNVHPSVSFPLLTSYICLYYDIHAVYYILLCCICIKQHLLFSDETR